MSTGLDSLKSQEAIDSWEYKRIVVEVNEEGKSYIATDKVSNVIKNPGVFHRADLWCVTEMPADNNIPGDRALEVKTREPAPDGVIYRQLIIYPDPADVDAHRAAVKHLHESVQQKHMPTDEDYQRHPSMHRTDTTDYISIIKGEMYLMTDTDEILMKPGDGVVIRGVNHAWSNRSNEPCVTVGFMIDAKPFEPYAMEPIEVKAPVPDENDAWKTWPNKRIVVGLNAEGKSCILTDQISVVLKNPKLFHRADLWCTREIPANNTIEGDRALEQTRREPFPCGTVFRQLTMMPEIEDRKEFVQMVKELHEKVKQTYMPSEEDYQRHPNMHRTDSVDFITVVKGEMYVVTDLDEMLMKPGDSCIIRGGNHAWANRSTEPCLTTGGMINALPRKI